MFWCGGLFVFCLYCSSSCSFLQKKHRFQNAVKWLKMHQIQCFLFMEVDNLVIFQVLEGQVSRCKDGEWKQFS